MKSQFCSAASTVTEDATQVDFGKAIKVTQLKLAALNAAPATADATGELGEIRVAAGFIYVCIATDTWVRAAIATWV